MDDELLQALIDDFDDELEMDDEPKKGKSVRLMLQLKKDETQEQGVARAALTPELHAAQSILELGQIMAFKEADINQLAIRLDHQTQQFKNGDLVQAESMLASQAHTLDALFHNLLRRSALNMKNEFSVVERLMRLALKAQSQCRTTLDSLASMKKPPSEIIKQTNIAHGHQQVNNFPEKQNPPNELLEKTDGERLDTETPSKAVRVDPGLASVGAKHRAKNG